jgi:hypothetical protein
MADRLICRGHWIAWCRTTDWGISSNEMPALYAAARFGCCCTASNEQLPHHCLLKLSLCCAYCSNMLAAVPLDP